MKFTLEKWDQTIAGLYDAVLQPELLAQGIAKANILMDSDFCHMLGVTPQGNVKLNVITDPSYSHAIQDYSNYFVDIDPRRKFVDERAVGVTYRCSSLFSPSFVDKNEFYQDFLKPHKLRYIIGACLYRAESMSVYAAFNHNLGRKPFTDEETKYFSLLNQHLSKIIAAIERARPLSEAINLGEYALDTLQMGVMGISAEGLVTYANKQARIELKTLALAKDGTARLAEGSTCRLLVQQVLADNMPHGARLADHRMVTGFIAPHSDEVDDISAQTSRTAVVLVFSNANGRGPRTSRLVEWFGLTAAEARLANALASGSSIEQYAATFSISVATARTQLRAVLKKTGADRQQTLVRMLASLPPL